MSQRLNECTVDVGEGGRGGSHLPETEQGPEVLGGGAGNESDGAKTCSHSRIMSPGNTAQVRGATRCAQVGGRRP